MSISIEHHRAEVIQGDILGITTSDVLSIGLAFVGFEKEHRERVVHALNEQRFIAHFEVPPDAVLLCFTYLKDKYPDVDCKEVLMSLNWWKTYDVEHVLSGRWGFGEKQIREKVKDNSFKIASLKSLKTRFGGFHDDERYVFGVDGVHFLTEEFRLDPSSKWYDFKSHSCGLKYKFAMVHG